MAKQSKSVFVCGECGYESGGWLGKCPACGSWNTLVEMKNIVTTSSRTASVSARAMPLSAVPLDEAKRVSSGIGEFDRVLGGGAVRGSVVLIGGDPGIGKSTLLMQAAAKFTPQGGVLYVTGEESASQLKLRSERLGAGGDMLLLAETDLSIIQAEAERCKPAFLIIDSIQTMHAPEIASPAGSITQVREATALLTRLAKTSGCTVFIVGHVTKEGSIAGPRMLEHMVDTVLYFEGSRHDAFRLLRAVKNRFGSTDEIGVFEMRDTGMAEITDPSGLFLTGTDASGCAVTCAMEGTRPMLVEVQALLNPSPFNNPRRMCAGLDASRLSLLLAVLEKKAGLRLSDKDVYVNVMGGIRLEERAGDIAVAVCVASALLDIPVPRGTAFIGELALTGELRPVSRMEKRVQECARLGYTHIVLPRLDMLDKRPSFSGAKLVEARTLADALQVILPRPG